MVNLDKIYTRGGDAGQTSLASGTRVPKHDLRVETYGTVDEANAFIGLARLGLVGHADDAVLEAQAADDLRRARQQRQDAPPAVGHGVAAQIAARRCRCVRMWRRARCDCRLRS